MAKQKGIFRFIHSRFVSMSHEGEGNCTHCGAWQTQLFDNNCKSCNEEKAERVSFQLSEEFEKVRKPHRNHKSLHYETIEKQEDVPVYTYDNMDELKSRRSKRSKEPAMAFNIDDLLAAN